MPLPLVVVIALAAALILFFVVRAIRSNHEPTFPSAEATLLEEAIVTEPVAPGMEGKAEIRKRGADPVHLRVRATDGSQAYARGSLVRVIDLREGVCIVEGADQEHLAR
jgi:hypothetical protein